MRVRVRERERESREKIKGLEVGRRDIIHLDLGLHFDVSCLELLQLLPQSNQTVLLLVNILLKKLQCHLCI